MIKPLIPVVTENLQTRVWRNIEQRGEDECWPWVGRFLEKYPAQIHTGGFAYTASHVLMACVGKPRPAVDLVVLHSCDNARCMNPKHLRWGTQFENNLENIARYKVVPRMQPDDVRHIRASGETLGKLAAQYGVSTACICQIRSGKRHAHIS